MNYGRLVLAAVAATVVDMVYGFVVYANLLKSEFERYPEIYRSGDMQMAFTLYMVCGLLLATLVASYIYAKGYEGGSGVQEGMRFGVLIGMFAGAAYSLVNYSVMNLGRKITGEMAIAGLVEWTIIGIVIGVVYKPSRLQAK